MKHDCIDADPSILPKIQDLFIHKERMKKKYFWCLWGVFVFRLIHSKLLVYKMNRARINGEVCRYTELTKNHFFFCHGNGIGFIIYIFKEFMMIDRINLNYYYDRMNVILV